MSTGSSFTASRADAGTRQKSAVIATETVSAYFEEALSVIRLNHAGTAAADPDSLTAAAISSMLRMLDPHSNYYAPAEFKEMLDEHASEYTGIGTSISSFERNGLNETFILSALPGSPAGRAGLKFGDRIVAVDGQPVEGKRLDEVRDLLRGKRSTTLSLTIAAPSSESRRTIIIKRELLHDTAVPRGFVMPGGIGYIDVTNGFSKSTFTEFESSLAEAKRQGASSLIVDLRGNGGGILEQAIKLAEKFLAPGSIIVSQRGRTATDNRTWQAGKVMNETLPLVLLVDEQSASATEVFAGALQDNDRALIVGRKTYGKGLVQSVLNLPDGAGLTLTAARYFTPAGRSIQRDYAETGLYDYYNHRTHSGIDKPLYAARTLTGRVVYGGDGVSPDVQSTSVEFTPARIKLLAPIFHFTRAYLVSVSPGAYRDHFPGVNGVEPSALSDKAAIDSSVIESFRTYLGADKVWSTLRPDFDRDAEFVRNMLRYYLSMGAFGINAANRARVESDPEVLQAIRAMPKSARLNLLAQKVRRNSKKQKGPLSLVLNGLR